ncbi:MAG: hypothetical protein NT166_02165 [Candidatus Aminicenantes bacterium]|nr:hypothetical protein [Candidatus Aminicenantes bacterium]
MRCKTILITAFILFIVQFAVYAEEQNLPNCDLGAEMINFEIVKQIDAKTVHVKITGKLKNLGSKDFKCEKGQVTALLSEGSRTPENTFTVVVEKEIMAIPVGEFFDLVYERDWEIADLDKFDGQPNYRLELKYSPTILQDDNPDNDDSVAKNNVRTRTTKQLRRIWAAYPKN